MVVLKRRSRLVTFRTSADEYEALLRSCVESGARSLAEYARAAVLEHARGRSAGPSIGLTGDLNTLGQSLSELDEMLMLARKRIQDVLGTSSSEKKNAAAGAEAITDPGHGQ